MCVMCVCVCLHVRVHVHVCICVYVCARVSIHVHLCTHVEAEAYLRCFDLFSILLFETGSPDDSGAD